MLSDYFLNTFSSLLVLSFLESSWSHCPLSGHSGSVQYWSAVKRDDTIKLHDTLCSKVPQIFLYFLQYIFGGLLEKCMHYSHVQELHFWEHKATQYNIFSKCHCRCVCAYALTSWVRVSSDFPRLILWLVEPCLSDLQLKKHYGRKGLT